MLLTSTNIHTNNYFKNLCDSYCFKAFIFDDTGRIMLTCFSDEAHSIVTSCTDLIQKSTKQMDPYKLPPELAALEKKTYIFQLHYGKDSTKEEKNFFLDKGWDMTPTIAALSNPDVKALLPTTEDEAEATTKAITISQPISHVNIPTAIPLIEPKTTSTPVPQEIHIPDSSSAKTEKKNNTARRQLFQTTKAIAEEPSSKKSKKND